jgi:hypothetical protein
VRVLFALVLAVSATGCYASAGPSPAGGIEEVIANLVLRGVTVERSVSGDAGCADPTLHDNAVHVTASYEGVASELYIFQWRRTSDFDAADSAFASCVDTFRGTHPGLQVSTLSAAPWRAYGAGDVQPIMAVLENALRDAGAT